MCSKEWNLDSCASAHTTNNVDWIDADKEKVNPNISVADVNKLDAQLKGNVPIKVLINGVEKKVSILYVPDSTVNLLPTCNIAEKSHYSFL